MKTADVSTQSPRIAYLEQQRALVRSIMGGTFAMRQAGQTYLPKHPAESDGVYSTRLNKTFLDNFVSLAIDKASGKLFARPVKVEDAPPAFDGILDNVDRQGQALHPFIMDVAKQAFTDGISYVMADMPRTDGVQTLADEKALGVRPYAIHVKPESVLEIVTGMIAGTETVTRLRIMEEITIQDGWEYSTIQQVRAWYRDAGGVRWELYRQNNKKEWYLFEDGTTTFKDIYLVPFYTNRAGYMEGLPPFQNIAESNLEHWQWKSEHAHALSMCCFGMYTATGAPDDFKFEVGPAKCQISSSPDTQFGVLETTGTGVTLAADTLKAIESRIEATSVNLRVENAGQVTATAAALDSEETNAGLKAVAQGFSDSVGLLLQYFAEMMQLDPAPAGSAVVNDDFGTAKGSQAGLQELTKARAQGDVSRSQYLDALMWRGELPPDFDKELNEEELQSEGPALGTIAVAQ